MLPADQGFGAGNLSRLEIDFRLVMEQELLSLEGAAQAALRGIAARRPSDSFPRLKNWKLLRPFSLAWYMAVSAFLMSVSASSPSSG